MRHCVESLLPGGKDVEIIIINDGSSDLTAIIAEEYAAKYPEFVRVIHQKNSGHGGAINTGIKFSTGTFVKVVDSDDWVEYDSYIKILETLKAFPVDNLPDILISNFVYEKVDKKKKTVMRYTNVLPKDKIFSWDDTGHFHKGQYILMHSIIYRRGLLKECSLRLPLHTFYVDNLYAYLPIQYVKNLYYVDVDFYRYHIGRPDQSVQENNMIKYIDHQLFVNRLMITAMSLNDIEPKRKREYLFNYLEIVTTVSSTLLIRSDAREHLIKKKELWQFIYENNKRLYNKLRYGFMGQLVNLPGKTGRIILVSFYNVCRKAVGFN
jgi:glycosyltransferase involved in cell wall biosynthesis